MQSLHNRGRAAETKAQPQNNPLSLNNVLMCANDHKPEHQYGKFNKNTEIQSRASCDERTVSPQRSHCKLTSHQKRNKRKQSSDCPQFNTQQHVHGQNHANAHLFRVSGIEWKQDGGKQWLNVFVTESQKLIAAYLHSQDRSSSLNGGSCVVNKAHC